MNTYILIQIISAIILAIWIVYALVILAATISFKNSEEYRDRLLAEKEQEHDDTDHHLFV